MDKESIERRLKAAENRVFQLRQENAALLKETELNEYDKEVNNDIEASSSSVATPYRAVGSPVGSRRDNMFFSSLLAGDLIQLRQQGIFFVVCFRFNLPTNQTLLLQI